jgi:protein SCO1/2
MNSGRARRHALLAFAGAATTLLGVTTGLSGCDQSGGQGAAGVSPFKGTDLTWADYAKELGLPDVDGKVRTLAEFKGKVVAVFFGYVQCPDVCPTTMAELAAVKQQLGADGAKLQPVFVTVDPERDTAAVLKPYLANFGSDFIALRGESEQIKNLAKSFKVFYAKVPGKSDANNYTMDHSAAVYLFDTEGRVRVYERYGTPVDALVNDVKVLLAGR